MDSVEFYKCLADETRLQSLLLIERHDELCVCELTEAMDLSQPKISRHLAMLRRCGILEVRRQSQWVYYRLHDELPAWCRRVLELSNGVMQSEIGVFEERLLTMKDRPESQCR